MPNRHRGEIEACLDGKPYRLCLTLGALAELESAFGAADMVALATRFESGRISAREVQQIIGAGLRGAGNDIADSAIAAMQAEGGAAGYIAIVAELLNATFGVADQYGPAGATSADAAAKGAGGSAPRGPFPGTM